MREDLINKDLFGNEAGEDEDKKRLNDYYFEKDDLKGFYNKNQKLAFARARKGVGKSALLNHTANKISTESPEDIIINIKAAELISLYGCEGYEILNYMLFF